MKERVFYLDLIRVIACLMIILMHSPMPGDNIIGLFAFGSSYFTMPAIGLFFAVSGALLLPNLAPPHFFSKKEIIESGWPNIVLVIHLHPCKRHLCLWRLASDN